MLNLKITITILATISACKMTVHPRLCFTCLYLTVYTDGSPLSLVRIEKACSNIKDKCCMKKRPRIRRVGTQTTSDKSVAQQNDMLRRRFLIWKKKGNIKNVFTISAKYNFVILRLVILFLNKILFEILSFKFWN